MKPRNLILQSAIAMAFGVGATTAIAGQLASGPETYAVEANPGVNAIASPDLLYQFGEPINPNIQVEIKIAFTNSAIWVAAPAAGQLACTDAVGGVINPAAAATITDPTTAIYTVNTGANGFLAINSSCTFTPVAAQMKAPSLATAGGFVNAKWNNFIGATEVDAGGTHEVLIANSALAITGTITSSASFPVGTPPTLGVAETALIDLTGSNSTKFVFGVPAVIGTNNVPGGVAINLGAVTFTDTPGIQLNAAGAADYKLATDIKNIGGTVKGNFQAGSELNLGTGANCAATIPAGSGGVLDATNSVYTFTGATTPATAVPWFFCYITTGVNIIPISTPVAEMKTVPNVVTDLPDTAAGNLYTLRTNGATVDIATFVPAGNIGSGYLQFIRIINIGNRATPILATIVNQDGTLDPALTGEIVADLPIGGAVTLTSREIELAIGAVPIDSRPRLRIFGATSFIDAQSFMSNPGGVVTNNSATERSGPPIAP